MAKPASRPAKRGGSSIFTGVLIGLILGAILAGAVALWISGSHPFKLAPVVAHPPPAPHPAAPAATTPDTAPSFDFYKVLPGDAPNALPAPKGAAANAPLYYLQAGAFQNPAEADNLKAQLALLGVEAVIQSSDVGGKGVLHRVRVGPLRSVDEVNRTRSLLTQNNISVTLVKEISPQQETP